MIHLLTDAVNQCGQLAMHVLASSVVSFGTALLHFGYCRNGRVCHQHSRCRGPTSGFRHMLRTGMM